MITAAVLLIGDELLSGRTQDLNLNYIANRLGEHGIVLQECRVVPDIEAMIIEAVKTLSTRNTYVFTTGGIGSTHDDITQPSIAKAFNKPLITHPEALKLLEEYYGDHINDARRRMARAAEGAILHAKMVFQIENVFVMAGIPKVMQEMFEAILPKLAHANPILSVTVKAYVLENDLADELTAMQTAMDRDVTIGSYPFNEEGHTKGTNLVARSRDAKKLAEVKEKLQKLVDKKLKSQIVSYLTVSTWLGHTIQF
ncbi:MAG: competence/damage-inducible protein A [Proteobacteria bacterium]|nr:competence/damage-inducible protein A [Pseudomonadota bacterium]